MWPVGLHRVTRRGEEFGEHPTLGLTAPLTLLGGADEVIE